VAPLGQLVQQPQWVGALRLFRAELDACHSVRETTRLVNRENIHDSAVKIVLLRHEP
jgi:hypothetical protein